MIPAHVCQQMKRSLLSAFGSRFRGVILYGSEARGEAHTDSDIDLLVLLQGPVDEQADGWACIRAVYPAVQELQRPIHPVPTDVAAYDNAVFPLYSSVKAEGTPL